MLHFEGTQDFVQSPDVVHARLSDAQQLVNFIPDLDKVNRAGPNEASCTVRPGFSFVRGTLELTVLIGEKVAEQSQKLSVATRGIGSSSKVDVLLQFAPQGDGTRVQWSADVKELGGLLKAVPQGLLKAAAQKVITDVWASVEKKMA